MTLIFELLVLFAELSLGDRSHHQLLLLLTNRSSVSRLNHVLELVQLLANHLKVIWHLLLLLLLLVVIFVAHFEWELFELMFATQKQVAVH